MKNERKNLKKNQLISFVITVVVIVAVNIIASFVYTRIDLTSEKRYTLSDTSKEVLSNLDDYVYFRIPFLLHMRPSLFSHISEYDSSFALSPKPLALFFLSSN